MVSILIGITCNFHNFENRLSAAYVRAISCTGAVPLLFPVTPHPYSWEQMLQTVDGLLLTGGGDPDAVHFGEEALPAQGEVQPNRDEMELFLARRTLALGIPVLGICRGVQLLNIAAGGTLHQDLAGTARVQHDQKAPRSYPIHRVSVKRPSLLYHIVQQERFRVNSMHHQAVKSPGAGAVISAVADDGVVEAVEFPHHPFALGVQWHPEWLTKQATHAQKLFAAFCAVAGKCQNK
ncbi:MAG: gamma-glutamyl-gamma-aminobutyrate hydrolase family protein [Clostridiales bacterium]|jgi:putative glutamine amidotransferase|nr:gamma-glutamyl-gamma-aminobutyrate hydrolase family protein [Clostridiales bacterium]